jgi:hypothetical protein
MLNVTGRRLSRFFLIAAFLLGPLFHASSASAATAAVPSPELKSLQSMVDNMGYTTTLSPTAGHFYISSNNKNVVSIDFAMSDDKSYIWIYSQIETYTPEQVAQLPLMKLLEANDNSPEFFSINNDSGKISLYVQIAFPAQGATPKTLRTIIDHIGSTIDDNAALWDPAQWKK